MDRDKEREKESGSDAPMPVVAGYDGFELFVGTAKTTRTWHVYLCP